MISPKILEQLKADLATAAHRLADPLSRLQVAESSDYEINCPSGQELLIGELMMVALMLSSSDNQISDDEVTFINEIAQAIQGHNAPLISSNDFMQTYREFVSKHPGIRLTLDQVPLSVRRLQAVDEQNGTSYADDAKSLFLLFCSAITWADGEVRGRENAALGNFEAILYPKIEES